MKKIGSTQAKKLCLFYIFSILLLPILLGCTRKHYRVKADNEAYSLLSCAAKDPRWNLDDYRIDVDPRSRMHDRYDPDCEPMPSDDPASHRKMRCVAGMKGSKHWGKCGCTKCVENPFWRQYLLFNDKGAVELDQNGAVELALLNSPEYQTSLENLYLSALDVSQERFRFDVQFYGGDSLFYTANGRLRTSSGTFLTNDANVQATKLFSTGGELVVGLANSITWSFNGQNSWYADSLFNVGLVQPLLRGAGKKVVLENLTQSERDFLASLRQMVFFQQGFYTKIVTGQNQVSGPSGEIRANYTPTLQSGFYGLLAEQIRIQNQRQNIVRLEDNLERFKEVFAAGQLTDIYQVEETRQNLLNSESQLLQRIGNYNTNVDTYLRSLGLPPDLKAEVKDPLMGQFQLTSSTLTDLQADLNQLLSIIRKKNETLPDDFVSELQRICKETEGEIKTLYNDLGTLEQSIPKRRESLKALESQLQKQIKEGERYDSSIFSGEVFVDRIEQLKNIDAPKNVRRLKALFALVDLIAQFDEPTIKRMIQENSFDDDIIDALHILKLVDFSSFELEDNLVRNLHDPELSDQILARLRAEFKKKRASNHKEKSLPLESPHDADETVAELFEKMSESQKIIAELKTKDVYRDWVRKVLGVLQNEMVSLSIMQTRARLDSIVLVPTTISSEDAFRIASENRLDWMNKKAELVDAWRQIDISANKLRSDLNLKVEGEIGTIDKKGVRFDGDNGKLRVGVEWDSPLTRHNEMIDYRRAQVKYQSARREYYTYVDSVNADLRNILRNIEINMVEFEIKRNTILAATIRVDMMQLKMDQPPQRGGKIDTNTADQLIRALDGLMTSQNEFLSIWVAYQTQRMLLDLKMGTMELDPQGRWIDPGTITKDRTGAPATYGNRYANPYGGAFASDSGLRPSGKRHKNLFGKRRSADKTGNSNFISNRSEEEIFDAPAKTIPPAPSLGSNNLLILNENRETDLPVPTLAPTEQRLPEPETSLPEQDREQEQENIRQPKTSHETLHEKPAVDSIAPKSITSPEQPNEIQQPPLSMDTIPNQQKKRRPSENPTSKNAQSRTKVGSQKLKGKDAPPRPRTPE